MPNSEAPWISLADFATTFDAHTGEQPEWVHPDSATPLPLDTLAVRHRLEDVLDTVVALQRAKWLQDGVYVGPHAMGDVYKAILHCARELRVAVPAAIMAGAPMSMQGCVGTDARATLYLSTFFFGPANDAERRFLAGRLCGHIAARQVTAGTLYGVLVDTNGLRSVARRAVGPVLEVVLAPLGLGVRLALSRWHRAAEITADRAGMLCAGSLGEAGRAMLRLSLAKDPDISPEEYLGQLRATRNERSPGRFAELLAAEPFTHKRLKAMELFSRSELWARHTGEEVAEPLTRDELDRQTSALLGVS